MIAVVGKGLVGKYIADTLEVDGVFDSANIKQLQEHSWNTVYCAAPSGNRLWVEQNYNLDLQNIQIIVDACKQTVIKKFVLISTGDAIVKPYTNYGANRLHFEKQALAFFNSTILRLPSIIHHSITKNMLWDIKHNQWLDKINPNNLLQWYVLENLKYDLKLPPGEYNLCSEPIPAIDIVNAFAPNVASQLDFERPGDVYDLKPYYATKQHIFEHMQEYLK